MGDGRADERNIYDQRESLPGLVGPAADWGPQGNQTAEPGAGTQATRPDMVVLAPYMEIPLSMVAAPILDRGTFEEQSRRGLSDGGLANPNLQIPPIDSTISTQPLSSARVQSFGPPPDTTVGQGVSSTPTDSATPAPAGVTAAPLTRETPPAAVTAEPATGSQAVAPIFKQTEQAQSGDPNQNGGNGKKPWRAGWGEIAPAYTEQPKQQQPAPAPVVAADKGQTTPTATGTEGGAAAEAEKATALKVEQSLRPWAYSTSTHTMVNAGIGGFSGFMMGGPAASLLDRVTKSYLAKKEIGTAGSLSLGEKIAIGYQRKHGLSGAEEALAPLFERDRNHSLNIIKQAEVLEPEIARIEGELSGRALSTLTEAERQALGRYRLMHGKSLPAGLEYELSAADVDDLTKHSELSNKISQLQADALVHKADDLIQLSAEDGKLESQLKGIVQKVEAEGKPALDKFLKSAKDAVTPAELEAANKYRFLSDYLERPGLDPKQYGVTLSTAEEALLKDQAQLRQLIANLEPTAKPALEKFLKGGEQALTAEELAAMRRFRFFADFAQDATLTPQRYNAQLDASDAALVARRQQVKGRILELEPHIRAQAELPQLQLDFNRVEKQLSDLRESLRTSAEPLEKKLAQAPETFLTEVERKTLARYRYLQKGGIGPVPADVELAPEEAELVRKRHATRQRIDLLDPVYNGMPELKLQTERINARIKEIVEKELMPKVADIEARVAINPATTLTAEENVMRARLQVLQAGGKVESAYATILTSEEYALLTEREAIALRLDKLKAQELKVPNTVNGHFRNFVKGMVVAEAAQFVDDNVLDPVFSGLTNSPLKNRPSWYTGSLAIPLGFAVEGGWWKKGGAMVGLYAAGHVLDAVVPAPKNPLWNRYARPNGWEMLAVGGAATIPIRSGNPWTRAGYIGAAWVGSKALSWALSGPDGKTVRDKGVEAWKEDKTERSEGSMSKAIEKFKDLANMGTSEEMVVKYYRENWLGRRHGKKEDAEKGNYGDYITGYRGAAILLTAIGESRLEKGTFVGNGQGKPPGGKLNELKLAVTEKGMDAWDSILQGQKLDLGGDALNNLVSARTNVERAITYTEKMLSDPNAEIRGTKVRKSEVDDLKEMQKRIDDSLGKIYGEHDMYSAYENLTSWGYNNRYNELRKIGDHLRNQIAKPQANDARSIAKLHRDIALVDLAIAGYKTGHNGVSAGRDALAGRGALKEALQSLQKADELDPKHKDVEQMRAIARDIANSVPAKEKSQLEHWFGNPFGTNPQ